MEYYTAAAETGTRTRALRVLRSRQLLLGQVSYITGMHEIKYVNDKEIKIRIHYIDIFM